MQRQLLEILAKHDAVCREGRYLGQSARQHSICCDGMNGRRRLARFWRATAARVALPPGEAKNSPIAAGWNVFSAPLSRTVAASFPRRILRLRLTKNPRLRKRYDIDG